MKKNSVYQTIKAIIQSYDYDRIFNIRDFYKFGNPNNIKVILFRLEKEKEIQRIMGGMYHRSFFSKLLGDYAPADVEKAARKLADTYRWKIVESGENSLNTLHLSTQVPKSYVFASTGPYRDYYINGIKITFKHVAPKYISGYSYITALVIQAFKTLGIEKVDTKVIKKLSNSLSENDINIIQKEASGTSLWIYQKIMEIQRNDQITTQ